MKISTASVLNSEFSSLLPLGQHERWYVARTLAQRELQAARQLTNQGYRVFLPRYLRNRRHARKVETISSPLFPRYLFTILDLARDRWRSINGTIGVERLLTCAGEPQSVPHELVERLILATDPQGNIQFDFHLREGQAIKVTAGPFANFVGQLERMDEHGRVRVLLEIMGGGVRVALPQTLVAPSDHGSGSDLNGENRAGTGHRIRSVKSAKQPHAR